MADFNIKQITKAVSGVVSAAPGVLQNINGENWTGVVAYFQIFNLAVVPTLGMVPLFTWRIPIDGRFNANLPGPSLQSIVGQAFSLGISVGWSTTDATYTAAAIGGKWWATGRNDT